MPTFAYPDAIAEKPLSAAMPTLLIDGAFRILQVNEAAAQCGVQIGEYLLPPDSDAAANCRLWHEACLSGAVDSPIDPLQENPRHVRVRLSAFHGFRLADIVYAYTLGRPRAAAVLYRSSRQFFQLTAALEGGADVFTSHMRTQLDRLQERCASLLQDDGCDWTPAREALLEFTAANAFLSHLPLYTSDCKRRFHVSFLLDAYLSEILPLMHFVDCRVLRTDSDDGDVALPTDAAAMFLLWTLLLTVLNDLADDRLVRVSWSRYGKDGEIRFSAHTTRLTALPAHIPSVSVLASYLPTLQLPLYEADYIAGCLDCYLDLYHDAAGTVTFSLYIPEEKHIPDFKSPRESQSLLSSAILCMRGLFRLLASDTTAPSEAEAE